MKIEGRTFVVSGGASGLGKACVENLVAHGAGVAILDFDEDLGRSLAARLGPSAGFFPCDVSDTESIASAVEAAVAWAETAGRPLGGVVTCAGVGPPASILGRDLEPLDIESLHRVLRINLLGTLDLARQLLPHLARVPPPPDGDGERGVVVMVSSGAAFDGQRGQVGYAASKGGVAAAALPMARDLARFGIRAVAVAPGLFESPMTAPMSGKVRDSLRKEMVFPARAGRGAEFAAMVGHVLENVMLNGTVIRLDGGLRFPHKL